MSLIALICSKYSAVFNAISLFFSMTQKYKVYINHKVVIFRNSKINIPESENQWVCKDPSAKEMKKIISLFSNSDLAVSLIILTTNPKSGFSRFSANYTIIKAAGGLVRNLQGDLLFIFRNGKWDLPKGKAEEGEKPKITAIREVMEETGLTDLTIVKKLHSTYHTYVQDNSDILKKTYWYEMLSNNEDILIPQTEEDITEVKWIKPSEIDEVLKNTFQSVFSLISTCRKVK